MADENKQSGLTPADVKAAVLEATAPLQAKIAALEAKNEPPKQPAKVWTRAELEQAVKEERITPAGAEEILERQNREATRNLVNDTVKSALDDMQRNGNIDEQIDAYSALVPDVMKEGTDERARVTRQYNYLVSIGLPKNTATELAALNAIYGSIDSLKASKSATQDFETHQETGGGESNTDDKKDRKIKMTAEEKRHYQYLIDKGMLKDWDAAYDELKYASSRVRARHGAKAA